MEEAEKNQLQIEVIVWKYLVDFTSISENEFRDRQLVESNVQDNAKCYGIAFLLSTNTTPCAPVDGCERVSRVFGHPVSAAGR